MGVASLGDAESPPAGAADPEPDGGEAALGSACGGAALEVGVAWLGAALADVGPAPDGEDGSGAPPARADVSLDGVDAAPPCFDSSGVAGSEVDDGASDPVPADAGPDWLEEGDVPRASPALVAPEEDDDAGCDVVDPAFDPVSVPPDDGAGPDGLPELEPAEAEVWDDPLGVVPPDGDVAAAGVEVVEDPEPALPVDCEVPFCAASLESPPDADAADPDVPDGLVELELALPPGCDAPLCAAPPELLLAAGAAPDVPAGLVEPELALPVDCDAPFCAAPPELLLDAGAAAPDVPDVVVEPELALPSGCDVPFCAWPVDAPLDDGAVVDDPDAEPDPADGAALPDDGDAPFCAAPVDPPFCDGVAVVGLPDVPFELDAPVLFPLDEEPLCVEPDDDGVDDAVGVALPDEPPCVTPAAAFGIDAGV